MIRHEPGGRAGGAWVIPIAACLAASACARVDQPPPLEPQASVPARGRAALALAIEDAIRRGLSPRSRAGVAVVSLATGETLYARDAGVLFTPASNQKLITAAAALSVLGAGFTVETTIARSRDGRALYLVGCGDAQLSPRDLEEMAGEVAGALEPSAKYSLSPDVSCFDDVAWGKGWMWDDEPDPGAMFVTPLSVNHNAITVRVSPGAAVGGAAVVTTIPGTSFVTLRSSALTAGASARATVVVDRQAGDRDNLVTIRGEIPLGSAPVEERLSVAGPERLAIALLAQSLAARGIVTSPGPRGRAPEGATVLARRRRRVDEMVRRMFAESDNLTAECLLKTLGRARRGAGTADAGLDEVRAYLERAGIATAELSVADGSGLSRYNLVDATTFVRVLAAVRRDPVVSPSFEGALPIAGRAGALAGRMRGTPATGNVRAKTGAMSGVSALSGYATSADGEPLAFSILVEHFVGSATATEEVQDRIATAISGFRR